LHQRAERLAWNLSAKNRGPNTLNLDTHQITARVNYFFRP